MRVRNLALAFVAAAAMTLPARADVILTYHLSSFNPPTNGDTLATGSQIPSNDTLGPAISGNSVGNPLMFMPNETKYIQIAIQVNSNPPLSVNGQNQNAWGNPSGTGPNSANNAGVTLSSFGFEFRYPVSLVINPFTPPATPLLNQNNTNARAESGPQPDGTSPGYVFAQGHPTSFTNYNMGGTVIGGLDTGTGLGTATNGLLPDTIIAVMKVRAGNTPGTGTIQLFDPNSAPTAASFGLLDNTNLDDIIFAPGHNNFPLFISVAVPEPSSMCLVGLAVAGFGWRKLRRKAKVA